MALTSSYDYCRGDSYGRGVVYSNDVDKYDGACVCINMEEKMHNFVSEEEKFSTLQMSFEALLCMLF